MIKPKEMDSRDKLTIVIEVSKKKSGAEICREHKISQFVSREEVKI